MWECGNATYRYNINFSLLQTLLNSTLLLPYLIMPFKYRVTKRLSPSSVVMERAHCHIVGWVLPF